MPSTTFGPFGGPSPSVPKARDCRACQGAGVYGPGPRYGELCEVCKGRGEIVADGEDST